jgi:hypothetical protein
MSPAIPGPVVAHVVAQQQLPEPVPRAHQITADVLARADHVTQRLRLATRHPDRVQAADHQQAHEALGVAAVGLDLVLRGTLDLPRRRDHTTDPGRRKRPRESEPGRPRLTRNPRGAWQPRAQRHHLSRASRQAEHRHLPGLGVDHTRHDLRGVHVQADPSANLRHGRFLLMRLWAPHGVPPARLHITPRTRRGGTGQYLQLSRTTTSIWSSRKVASTTVPQETLVLRAERSSRSRRTRRLQDSRHENVMAWARAVRTGNVRGAVHDAWLGVARDAGT